MRYTQSYNKAFRRTKKEAIEAVDDAIEIRGKFIGRLVQFIANTVGNRDGKISKEEWREAMNYRDSLVAQLEAGHRYLSMLIALLEKAAVYLGDSHGEVAAVVDSYLELSTIMPDIWAEYPELENFYHTELDAPLSEIVFPAEFYQERIDGMGQAIDVLASAFIEQIDVVYKEFESMGIKSLYSPLGQKRLQLSLILERSKALQSRS